MTTEVTSASITMDYHIERSPLDSEEEDDRGRDSVEMDVPQLYVSDSMKHNSLPMIFKLDCKLPLGMGEDDRTLMATPPLGVSSPNHHALEESSESDSETVSRDLSANDTVSRDTLDEEQEELSEDNTDREEVVRRRNKSFDHLGLAEEEDKRKHIREDLLIPSPMFMRKLSDRRSKVLDTMGTLPSILVAPEESVEDDVFQCDEKGDKNRAEKKLVDWALNVYVPACRTLLQRCAAKKVDAKKVLSDLRNLSNTVNFFCTEHQKQNEIRSTHGMSPSHSSVAGMDVPRSHNTSPILPRSRLLPSPVPLSLSPTPQESEASVAVKVLRSVSSSLLHPLLEGADNGFTKDFYRDIVVAIQKISWKVEACLTYNNQGEEYNVHKRIFDAKQTALVGSMMTALPPEEPSFSHTSPVHFVRGGKRSSKRNWLRTNTEPEKDEAVLASSANTRDSALDDTTHDPFTSGDRNFERRSGDSSSLSEDFHTRDEPGSPPTSGVESDMDYFRHTRRTTISLSKREVKSLGLHMIKPVDTSSRHHRSNTMGAVNMISRLHMMNQVTDDEPVNLRRVRDKVKAKIAKDFPEMDTERCGTPTERLARLSDMREDGEEETSKVTSSVEGALDLLSPTTTVPPLQIHQQPSPSLERSSLISDMSMDPDYILIERPPSSASKNRGRIKSLELDHLLDTTHPPQAKPQRAMTPSSSFDAREPYAASTMPHNKRKSVFSKLVKKKGPSKSFGRGDTIGRRRRNIRTRSTTLFNEDEDQKEPLFLESIEKFSRNVLPKNVPLEREESTQLVLTVELVSSKVSRPHQKRKSSITADFLSSSLLLEITVCSDIPELIRQGEYKILRTQKDLITLYDTLEEYSTTHLSPGAKGSLKFPDRPDKKKLVHKKERRQNAEELLRFFARRPELRTCDAFLEFLRPDDVFSTLQHKDSESFELLMTFYTPLEYTSGSPGSRHEVAVIGRGDITTTHTPTTPLRKGTSKKYAALSEGSSSVQVARVPGAEEDDVTLMIKEEGVPVLLVIEEENSHMVMAGRFEKLVEQLACQKKPDPRYVSTFLLGYRHFSNSEDLLTLLIRRFQMSVPPDASEEEMAYAEKWRYVIQLRVLDVLLFWMRTCWEDFHRNINMLEKLRQFISELKEAEDPNFKVAGFSMDNLVEEKLNLLTKRGLPSPAHSLRSLQSPSHSLKSTSSPSHSHKTTPSPGHTTSTPVSSSSLPRSLSSGAATTNGHRRRLSVDISSLTAIQLARQLTLIELDFLKSIDVYELAVYLWESNNQHNKPYRRNLDAYITRFNKVSYWVASEVCSVDDVRLRGTLIEKFIEVAKHCLEYKNFNTLVSVVTGISLSAVRRLKKSWEHVNEKSVKSFQKLKELTNPVRSHAMYRKTLAAVSPRCSGCIPYFGVFMRDVTLFNEGNPKRLRNGLLNFSKLRTLVVMFEELKHFQRSKYYFPSDDRTRQYCIELVCMSEQDLYDTSLALEPRESEQSNT